MDKQLKTYIDQTQHRRNAYFDRYITFRHKCTEELGILESDVPMLWVAYHLNELTHTIEST